MQCRMMWQFARVYAVTYSLTSLLKQLESIISPVINDKQLYLLTLNAPITTIVVFSCLLKCLRSLYGKQCGPRSDCSYRSSLFLVHAVCFNTLYVSNARQLFAANDLSRRDFQMHFFLGALRINTVAIPLMSSIKQN